ncbi:hypothetical protein ACH46_20295 [Gordonia phthalatica]|uniref:Helicase HerA central domain-containing protein n=1 Tax=Gordonia phthalatica TaxID=1136941 RepID=A0A0N9N724_9ACTN|nr:hypothetical protein ACH46_20295 [Gordonia phthalatica]
MIREQHPDGDLTEHVRHEFSLFLDEIASLDNALGSAGSLALELLFVSNPAIGQVHTGEIRTFLIVRALADTEELSEAAVVDGLSLGRSALVGSGFDVSETGTGDIARLRSQSSEDGLSALVRRARIVQFHNAALPAALVYDRFPAEAINLNRLYDTLVDSPGSHVSIQLIVDGFSGAESDLVSTVALGLGAIERGIQDPSMAGMSFATAKRPAETYGYYADRLAGSVFQTSVVIGGRPSSRRQLSSRMTGALAGSVDGGFFDVVRLPMDSGNLGVGLDETALPWRVFAAVDAAAPGRVWPAETPSAARRLPLLATAAEASQLFRIPFGTDRVGAGFRVHHTVRRSRTYLAGVVDNDLEVGAIGAAGAGVPLGFTLNDLTKHMFVTGTPGSGKTTFNVGMLDTLWHKHKIPFLVIEPAKNEYRALIESIPDLQVFTPGKSWLSPLVMNPFRPGEGVRSENHKTVLKSAFGAAVTMASPLDRLFEAALDNLYSQFGWLDSDDLGVGHPVPNVRDFVDAFRSAIDQVGYTGEAANIGRAGLVRLAGMVRVFDTYKSIPVEDLCTRPTLIELSAIENSAEKALWVALILLQQLSYHNANTVGTGDLRQVLLLEEAHVLFEASDTGQEGAASPAAVAQGILKRMLAEIRSYGVGIAIADQSPRKVGGDVIALTNIKLAFRIVEAEDREILGNSMNMGAEQVRRLSGLRPGEAFLFHDRLEEAEELVTPDYRSTMGISISIDDERLKSRLRYFDSRQELLKPFPECDLIPEWDATRSEVARQFASRIFWAHVTVSSDLDTVRAVYRRIRTHARSLDKRYSNVDDTLLDMIRVYFLRLVRFETELRLPSGFEAAVLSAQAVREG